MRYCVTSNCYENVRFRSFALSLCTNKPHDVINYANTNSFPEATVPQPWRFTSAVDVYGSPFSGILAVYGGGGYIAKLSSPAETAQAILTELWEQNWLDFNTKAVFIEFLLFNPGSNLYTASFMLIESFNGGGKC